MQVASTGPPARTSGRICGEMSARVANERARRSNEGQEW